MKFQEIDTPALLVDLDAMEGNLAKMARFRAAGPVRLRPHYKNHKCPALARRQIDAGAAGLACATLGEAEALVQNGFTDLLITSEMAGPRKIARLLDLAAVADVKTVADNAGAIAALGAAARGRGLAPGVLVNVDVGQNRTGCRPGEAVVELARQIAAQGLKFRGLMGYEGHLGHQAEGPEKEAAYDRAMKGLLDSRRLLEAAGIPVEIVSTGGTGTYHLSSRCPGLTESQAGSYLLMDTGYAATCRDFQRTLTILATVISRTEGERIVVDAGVKSISAERGLPQVKGADQLRVRKLNAEHGIVALDRPSAVVPEVGQTLELWVQYGDATVNLHDRMYGVRGGEVETVLSLRG